MSAEVENTHKEVKNTHKEEEQQPFQLTAVMKRPSLEDDLTTRQEDNSPSEDLCICLCWVVVAAKTAMWILTITKLFLHPTGHRFVISFSR